MAEPRVRPRLHEARPALVLVLASSVALLTAAVSRGSTAAFDRALLLGLREAGDASDPLGPAWFEEAARDVTALGGHAVLTLVTLAVSAYLLMAGKRGAALLVLVAVGGGMLLSTGLKVLVDRARPDLVPHGQHVYTASFPSGHAMISAATYLTLGLLVARLSPRRRAKAFAVAVAVLVTLGVGASRVYLGVHWPTDVLAGWAAGGAWAALVWLVALRLQARGRVERAGAVDGVPARP